MMDLRPGVAGMSVSIPDRGDHAAYEVALGRAAAEGWARRLHERDATLWTADAEAAAAIEARLGWLDAPAHFTMQIPALEQFGEDARSDGFAAAVVAGMGGSSLAAGVLRDVFGSTPDWLELRILDSTDPAAVAAAVDDLDPLATLFIVATKSGTTTESLAFQADAWERVHAALAAHGAGDESPGALMAAITEPGHSLDSIPHHDDLREVFLDPPDIGGRYAPLTYVGLVPASLIGIDLDPLLGSATAMLEACTALDPGSNPGLALGLAIGTLARAGRDKLTFVADPEIAAFGRWVEHLIAESTGKDGLGIVPIVDEPLGAVDGYARDRVFVRLSLEGSAGPAEPVASTVDATIAALEADGHPVVRIALTDPMDLGGEFVRWEIATAYAGAILGIDPFDQPDVEDTRERARRILAGHEEHRPAESPLVDGGLTLRADAGLERHPGDDAIGFLARHLARARAGDYLALQAFIAPTPGRDAAIARIRRLLRDATGHATTAGYGPRYLHSTGQLQKGGPPTGWFLQLTADHPVDRPIPGRSATFGRLIDAQALGDLGALEARGRPIVSVHLGDDPDAGLERLLGVLSRALEA